MVHCTICFKPVYKAEEVQALGCVWHKSCFKCGSNTEFGCRRVLRAGEFLDNNNNPFCNACYAKLYKPKGIGYGNALSSTELADNPGIVVASNSRLMTSEPLAQNPIFVPKHVDPTVTSTITESPAALFVDGMKPRHMGSAGLAAMLRSQHNESTPMISRERSGNANQQTPIEESLISLIDTSKQVDSLAVAMKSSTIEYQSESITSNPPLTNSMDAANSSPQLSTTLPAPPDILNSVPAVTSSPEHIPASSTNKSNLTTKESTVVMKPMVKPPSVVESVPSVVSKSLRDKHPSALYSGDGDEVDESEW